MKKTTFIVKTTDNRLEKIDAILLGTTSCTQSRLSNGEKNTRTVQIVYAQNRIAEITTVIVSAKDKISLQRYDIKTKVEYIIIPELDDILEGIKQPQELWNEEEQLTVNMLEPSIIEEFLKN